MRLTGKILSTLLFLSPFVLSSCNKNSERILIVTKQAGTYSDTLSPERDFSASKIGSLNTDKPGQSLKILTEGFYASMAPDISFDGKKMLFAGRKSKDDPWQIWEMDLGNGKSRQVTSGNENCVDPAYLPGNRIVFSKQMLNDSLKSHYSLFTCTNDGTGQERITFTPSSWRSSTVLTDGRILAISEKVYPVHGKPELIALRPDGTKAELFFNPQSLLHIKPFETPSSEIVFAKSGNGTASSIRTINYNMPFGSESGIRHEDEGELLNAIPYNNKWLASFRQNPGSNFGLYEFDSEGEGKKLFSDTESDVICAVTTRTHTVPKKLPSEVDILVKTGLLLCQDISYNGSDVKTDGRKTAMIEITGIDASYGKVDPAQDGSVYLKIIADMPFRISTLDENGHIISTCNWMTLRPNERRGCTGCHENPETVPENRLPLAVKNAPVIIPVHIEKITEKTVELE